MVDGRNLPKKKNCVFGEPDWLPKVAWDGRVMLKFENMNWEWGLGKPDEGLVWGGYMVGP